MRKVLFTLLLAAFAVVGFGARIAAAQAKGTGTCPQGEFRWHGMITRSSNDKSTLTVRKGNTERVIHYNADTKWTKQEGKNVTDITRDDVKDGADVITCNKADEKKQLTATRVDLRSAK